MRRYRQQTGESLHPERSHKAPGWLSSVESSPALGVHAPCDPLPGPTTSTPSAHTEGQSSSRSLSRSMKGSSM